MKKARVINLIKYYSEKNDNAFINEAYLIAKDFEEIGDYELAEYIRSLIFQNNISMTKFEENELVFLKKINTKTEPLPLPEEIKSNIIGIINTIDCKIKVNKFLFQGKPGTGKTEAAKNVARILNRDLFVVNFSMIIDSKLGQTGKNIIQLFNEINNIKFPEKVVILFDEIDAIALDRNDTRDIREMGRAMTSLLKSLEELNEKILLIATTNLYEYFDKALTRRFDFVVDFNKYSREDLIEISEIILTYYLSKLNRKIKKINLFKKIISLMENIPYPGELKNIIKISLAFSNPNDEYDYLRKLFSKVCGNTNLKKLKEQGFTDEEIELLKVNI